MNVLHFSSMKLYQLGIMGWCFFSLVLCVSSIRVMHAYSLYITHEKKKKQTKEHQHKNTFKAGMMAGLYIKDG